MLSLTLQEVNTRIKEFFEREEGRTLKKFLSLFEADSETDVTHIDGKCLLRIDCTEPKMFVIITFKLNDPKHDEKDVQLNKIVEYASVPEGDSEKKYSYVAKADTEAAAAGVGGGEENKVLTPEPVAVAPKESAAPITSNSVSNDKKEKREHKSHVHRETAKIQPQIDTWKTLVNTSRMSKAQEFVTNLRDAGEKFKLQGYTKEFEQTFKTLFSALNQLSTVKYIDFRYVVDSLCGIVVFTDGSSFSLTANKTRYLYIMSDIITVYEYPKKEENSPTPLPTEDWVSLDVIRQKINSRQ